MDLVGPAVLNRAPGRCPRCEEQLGGKLVRNEHKLPPHRAARARARFQSDTTAREAGGQRAKQLDKLMKRKIPIRHRARMGITLAGGQAPHLTKALWQQG